MNWKRWAIAAFVLCALLFVAAPFVANAASPWMEVKFLRVLVDVIVDDDLTVRDDLAVTDDTSLTGDLEVDGTTQLDGAVAINGAPTFAEETTFNDLVTHTRSIAVDGAVSETLITVQNCVSNTDDLVLIQDSAGANLVQVGYDGAVSTAAGVVADTVAATSTLTLESVAFSGPITFGAEANATDGVTIAHGLGTTPTVVSVTPYYATALTQTVWVSAADDTSFTLEIEPGSVTTLTNVYWFAGK